MSDQLHDLVKLLMPGLGTLRDYIVPGLDSTLLAKTQGGGCLRLFRMTRYEQEFFVTPHDHRYDFTCYVLDGSVENTVYRTYESNPGATHVSVEYDNSNSAPIAGTERPMNGMPETSTYGAGDSYSMQHRQFHTIRFRRNALVLFVEGPQIVARSHVLLPYRDKAVLNTFFWKDWMMTDGEKK